MRPLLVLAIALSTVAAQTSTSCDPLRGCHAVNPALGTTYSYDFSQGASDEMRALGNPRTITYRSSGAQLTVSARGDAPILESSWYIMYGRLEVQMKSAPGHGILSWASLISDTGAGVDFNWVGSDSNVVSTSILPPSDTARAVWSPSDSQKCNIQNHAAIVHTYAINWTPEAITWTIDGVLVRSATPATMSGFGPTAFPQTPMKVRLGAFAAGDPSNEPSMIAYSNGPIRYGDGPFIMTVQHISVADYSTGTTYNYTDQSGLAQSIIAQDGQIGARL